MVGEGEPLDGARARGQAELAAIRDEHQKALRLALEE
jgi:hypothetical protein